MNIDYDKKEKLQYNTRRIIGHSFGLILGIALLIIAAKLSVEKPDYDLFIVILLGFITTILNLIGIIITLINRKALNSDAPDKKSSKKKAPSILSFLCVLLVCIVAISIIILVSAEYKSSGNIIESFLFALLLLAAAICVISFVFTHKKNPVKKQPKIDYNEVLSAKKEKKLLLEDLEEIKFHLDNGTFTQEEYDDYYADIIKKIKFLSDKYGV